MKLRSKVAVLAAAGAFATVGATSALAMEHQFNGAFTLQYDVSNFNYGDVFIKGRIEDDPTAANLFEQRVRLGYTAKANDNLKLVTKFELDYSYWGNSSYESGNRNDGGALGSDTINLETKHLYLDMNVPSIKTNIKAGMQGFDDAFKGVFVGADMAGILLTHSYSQATASAGLFRFNDDNGFGKNTRDFFMVDGKYELNKNTRVGAAYYYVNSDNVTNEIFQPDAATQIVEDLRVHMLGVNAETTIGALTLDGFLAYQFGKDRATDISRSAYAANVGAKYKIAKNTLRGEFLYVSGDEDNTNKHSFYAPTIFGGGESGFYNNEMVILGRDKFAMTNDAAIVYDANNFNQGVVFGSIGYDHTFTDKLAGSLNAGFAAVAEDNGNTFAYDAGTHDSDYLGTEFNAGLDYKVMENLTLSTRGAYVVLGDYFQSSRENPYDFKLIAKYSY